MRYPAICRLSMAGLMLVVLPGRGLAEWTVHRQGLPLRLALGGVYSPQGPFLSQAGLAQSLWTHRLPNARVDSLWFIAGNGDEFFRYTDLVVHEHRPADQVHTLNWGLREWARLFEHLDQYDVLAFQGLPQVWQQADESSWWGKAAVDVAATRRLHQQIADFVKAGGTLLVTGPLAPPGEGSALRELLTWPAAESPQAVPHPIVAGVPAELLNGYGQLKVSAPRSGQVVGRRSADGRVGPGFAAIWPAGKGRVVHIGFPVATGYTNTPFSFLGADDEIDADEVSLRLLEQVFYWCTHGERAYPALVDLPVLAEAAPAGGTRSVPVWVRSAAAGPLRLHAEVVSPGPAGRVEWSHDQVVTVTPPETTVPLPLATGAHWGTGRHLLRVQVRDARAAVVYHEAWTALPIVPQVRMTLASDKVGYRPGEPVRLEAEITGPKDRALSGRLVLAVFDRRGRALLAATREVSLSPGEPVRVQVPWSLPATDLGAYTFWARAELHAQGRSWASAETRFYRWQRWDMRHRLNWGLCSMGQLEAGPGLPVYYRALVASGFNSINWTPPLRWMERVGWFGDTQDMMWCDTFSPDWVEGGLEGMRRQFQHDVERYLKANVSARRDVRSPAIAIRSVGEEGGYGGGWGTVWEWKEDVAPDLPTRIFREYLRSLYPNLEALNAQWDTRFRSWDEVPLRRQYVKPPEALHDRKTEPVVVRNHSPYTDTRRFFDWYYQRWVDQAIAVVRAASPVPLYVYSTGNVFGVKTEVVAEPSVWDPPPQPGYTLSWLQSADPSDLRGLLWRYTAAHIGQMSGYTPDWILNYDMTLSTASLANQQFMSGARRLAPALLQYEPARTRRIRLFQPANSRTAVRLDLTAALVWSGLPHPEPYDDELKEARVVLAPFALRVSRATADRLRRFVADGGTLVATQWFAVEDEHGKLFAQSPGLGLQELVGVRQSESHAWAPQMFQTTERSEPLPAGLALVSEYVDTKAEALPGTRVLASYKGGLPAVTLHRVGKGRVFWLNLGSFTYWNQWRYPFPDGYRFTPLETFRRLVLALVSEAGLEPDFELTESGHLPTDTVPSLFLAADDGIGHLVVARSRARHLYVPQADRPGLTGDYELTWRRPGYVAHDGATGRRLDWAAAGADRAQVLRFHLEPGEGRLFTFVPYEVQAVQVVAPPEVRAGEPITLQVRVEARGRPAGEHVVAISGTDPQGRPADPFDRVLTGRGPWSVTVGLAVNDPVGRWTVTATDLATGVAGTAPVTVQAPAAPVELPRFRLGWPSEEVGHRVVADEQFLDELARLSRVYLTPGGDRFRLSFYQQWHGDTRHNLATRLAAVDWRRHTAGLRRWLEQGGQAVLVGEDLGRHPFYGFDTYPHASGHQLSALAAVVADVRPIVSANRPSLVIFPLKQGRLVLDRDSWDEHVWRIRDYTLWQERWLREVQALMKAGRPSPAPIDLAKWFNGQTPIPLQGEVTVWADYGEQAMLRFQPTETEKKVEVALPAGTRVLGADLKIDPVPDPSFVANGDFERGGPDKLEGWSVWGGEGGPDAKVFHGGKHSLRLAASGAPVTGAAAAMELPGYVPPQADLPIALALWVRGENVKAASFGCYGGPGGVIAFERPLPTGSYDWQRVEIECKAGRLVCGMLQPFVRVAAGILWVDDIESLAPREVRLLAGPRRLAVAHPSLGEAAGPGVTLAAALNRAVSELAADPDGRVRVPLWVVSPWAGAVRLSGLRVVVGP